MKTHSANPSTPNAGSNILGIDLINLNFATGYLDEYSSQNTVFKDGYINPFVSQAKTHSANPSTPSVGSNILGIDLINLSFATGYSDKYSAQNTVFTDKYGQSC